MHGYEPLAQESDRKRSYHPAIQHSKGTENRFIVEFPKHTASFQASNHTVSYFDSSCMFDHV